MTNLSTYDSEPQASGLLGKIVSLPAKPKMKWAILAFWIALAVILTPVAAKLTGIQENNAESWLPAGAESLRFTRELDKLPGSNTYSAVVVYHRDGGLTASDQAKIAADRSTLATLFPASALSENIPSEDGSAMIYMVPFEATENASVDELIDNTEGVRDTVGKDADGLQVKVTGEAGFSYDMFKVFEGIDGILLLAAASVVTVLLLLTYRSPFLWLMPLLTVAIAHQAAGASVFGVHKILGITVDGQSAGILPVLVFGAGTDYALLLIARYREELRRHEDKHEAMAYALKQAGPAILASGGTVIAGLLCLIAADLNSTAGLGPIGALGIACSLIAMMTLLPALLLIVGRRVFWPFVPHFGSEHLESQSIWGRVGSWVSRRPRPVWVGTTLLLAFLALGTFSTSFQLEAKDMFNNTPDSVTGQELIAQSYPAGAAQPTLILTDTAAAESVMTTVSSTQGVAQVYPHLQTDDKTIIAAVLTSDPSSSGAYDTVKRLRTAVHAVPGANALVGGPDASNYDVTVANRHDRILVMPLVLLVVIVILMLLLQSILAPLLLAATVVVSYLGALGASSLLFTYVLDMPGIEPSIPLLGFVFLVALGIDYNIFLVGRAHEEAKVIGTRQGMLRAVAVTGGVITSAGLVLAATFGVMTTLPLTPMIQIGFLVAIGVLIDTFIVRSVLVPALTFDIGPRIWWPSRLSRGSEERQMTVTRPWRAEATFD